MKKIIVVGAGNIGKAAAKALLESPDFELCGFVRQKSEPVTGFEKIPVAENVFGLPEKPEGAIITVPSRLVEPIESKLLENGIYAADCFDIHEELPKMRKRLQKSAEKGKISCVVGAGWDPGLDSAIRTLMFSAFPESKIYTNFGPGMSMGHSAVAKSIDGIADAVSITLPLGKGKHLRKIYAVLEKNADKKAVEHAILSDSYFEHDECSVEFVDSAEPFFDTKHGVFIENIFGNQKMNFLMEIDNPTLTGNVLVSAMRAAFLQKPGAYFMPEIPPFDFLAEKGFGYL
ncbi:MAG: diaminopimelate dehydrogenase [Ruminococcaceae bacterium]|nr:diaminopimelate dehydrogenase [Oscillospiraceae bacterium]